METFLLENNFDRRAAEHLREKGIDIDKIPGLSQLSREDARAVEQVLIEHYGLDNLMNKINSISPNNPNYDALKQHGLEILNDIGYKLDE